LTAIDFCSVLGVQAGWGVGEGVGEGVGLGVGEVGVGVGVGVTVIVGVGIGVGVSELGEVAGIMTCRIAPIVITATTINARATISFLFRQRSLQSLLWLLLV
jgi:hypothetical protein